MDTDQPIAVQPSAAESLVERLLSEGEESFLDACRTAGLKRLPNVYAMMRAARSRALEAFKSQGRWRTSAPAVIRWLARQQPSHGAHAPAARADANAVLSRYGLGRDPEAQR